MVSKRMTKQEVREDRVAVVASQAVSYVQKNARWVIAAIAAMVVVIVVGVLVAQGRMRAQQEAAVAMVQAETAYFGGDFSNAAPQFQVVADRYGSTPSARMARLYQGNSQLALGNSTAAQQAYQQFLDSNPQDPTLRAAALRGLGGALAGEGKAGEAAERYAGAAAIDGNPLADQDWLQAGRSYAEAGQWREAADAFREVLVSSPQGQAAQEARVRLQEALAHAG